MVVKLPGEERQFCIVGAGKVIPETISSVQRWMASSTPLSNHQDNNVQSVYITVLQRVFLLLEM